MVALWKWPCRLQKERSCAILKSSPKSKDEYSYVPLSATFQEELTKSMKFPLYPTYWNVCVRKEGSCAILKWSPISKAEYSYVPLYATFEKELTKSMKFRVYPTYWNVYVRKERSCAVLKSAPTVKLKAVIFPLCAMYGSRKSVCVEEMTSPISLVISLSVRLDCASVSVPVSEHTTQGCRH